MTEKEKNTLHRFFFFFSSGLLGQKFLISQTRGRRNNHEGTSFFLGVFFQAVFFPRGCSFHPTNCSCILAQYLKRKKNAQVCHVERVKAAIAHNDVGTWTISARWIYAGRRIFADLSQVLPLLLFSLSPFEHSATRRPIWESNPPGYHLP